VLLRTTAVVALAGDHGITQEKQRTGAISIEWRERQSGSGTPAETAGVTLQFSVLLCDSWCDRSGTGAGSH
jgi:hypothetical protein